MSPDPDDPAPIHLRLLGEGDPEVMRGRIYDGTGSQEPWPHRYCDCIVPPEQRAACEAANNLLPVWTRWECR